MDNAETGANDGAPDQKRRGFLTVEQVQRDDDEAAQKINTGDRGQTPFKPWQRGKQTSTRQRAGRSERKDQANAKRDDGGVSAPCFSGPRHALTGSKKATPRPATKNDGDVQKSRNAAERSHNQDTDNTGGHCERWKGRLEALVGRLIVIAIAPPSR